MPLLTPSFLSPGDPAPWFQAEASNNPRFHFDTVAGRYVLICFLGSAATDDATRALSALHARRSLFDDRKVSFFGVSADPQDRDRLRESLLGIRYFWDHDLTLARKYGALLRRSGSDTLLYRPHWLLLDPTLRVMATASLDQHDAILNHVASLPEVTACTHLWLGQPIGRERTFLRHSREGGNPDLSIRFVWQTLDPRLRGDDGKVVYFQ